MSSSSIEPTHATPVVTPIVGSSALNVDHQRKDIFRGPLSAKRSCTDIVCLFLFFIVFVGFIAVSLSGILIGNPLVLFMGHDSTGQMCGVGSLRSKMFLLPYDPLDCIATRSSTYMTSGCSPSVCVESCPNMAWNWPNDANKTAAQLPFIVDKCQRGTNTNLTIAVLVSTGKCPPYLFPSTPFVFRCEPVFLTNGDAVAYNESKLYKDASGAQLKTDEAARNVEAAHNSMPFINDLIQDLSKSWPQLLAFTGITMAISFLWILLLRFLGPFLIWFSVTSIVIGTGLTSAFCFIIYDAMSRGLTYALGVIPIRELSTVPRDVWLAIGLISAVLFLVVLLVFCALFNRIRLAAAIVGESSRAVAGSMAALFWPVIPFACQLVIHGLFLAGTFFFLTSTSSSEPELNITTLEENVKKMWPVFIALLFGWFWITNFILAVNYVTLAGSFSSWYWNHDTNEAEFCQLFCSFGRAFRYHLGTLAFGALIIAIVQFIRAILQFFERQFRKMQNPIGALMLKCLICCIWCLEKLLKIITKNAYILVAIEGKNFCSSARKAFNLIVGNSVRTIVLDTISSVLITISIFVIVSGVGIMALFVFCPTLVGWSWLFALSPHVKYFYIPLTVELIASLLAALCFFSVYKMAIDTVFLNLLVDLKHNHGTPEKPYRASRSLLNIVSRKNNNNNNAEQQNAT